MNALTISEMEVYVAGDFIEGLCLGIATGSVVYGIGLTTNWWNPVGWASATFLIADTACVAYGLSEL